MSNADEIGVELLAMRDAGSTLSIHEAGKSEPVLARVASVDEEEPFFALEIFGAPPEGPAVCVGMLRGAKIQFDMPGALAADSARSEVHHARFPASCLILNRRSAPRVQTPLGEDYTVSFMLDGRRVEMALHDFSSGGVGMRAGPRQTHGLHVGKLIERAKLELGKDAIVVLDLEVRLSRRLGDMVQVGCQFKNVFPGTQEEIDRRLGMLAPGLGRK